MDSTNDIEAFIHRWSNTTEALDQRDCAAVGLICLHARLLEQEPHDHAVYDLQHGTLKGIGNALLPGVSAAAA